jgi:glycerophosphoryl diester phosphodiesterase
MARLVLRAAALLLAGSGALALRAEPLRESRTPAMLVIAHRGASGYAPEHTFAAWDRALELGADYLEQDLQMTRDGVLVVMHDETLERTARREGRACTGRVIDHTIAELRACEVGSWFNDARPDAARPEYSGQPVPTLGEVFGRYAGRAPFYIETKQPEAAPGMEESLVALLDAHDLREAAAAEWQVLLQSFSEASLRRLRALDERLPLIQLIERGDSARGIEARLATIAEYAVGIGPHHSDLDAGLVAAAHAHCLAVHPYTVNTDADMVRLTALGVDGMFTDYADRLLARRPAGEPRGLAAAAAAARTHARCRERAQRTGS